MKKEAYKYTMTLLPQSVPTCKQRHNNNTTSSSTTGKLQIVLIRSVRHTRNMLRNESMRV